MRSITAVMSALALAGTAFGFAPNLSQPQQALRLHSTQLGAAVERRGFLTSGVAGVASILFTADASFAEGPEKVLVLGGTGMVGSEVVKVLQAKGVEVIATSTNGRDGTVAVDFTEKDLGAKIESLAKGCTAVISCVGVIGTDSDAQINSGSGIAASAAKSAGCKHFAYISVAPEVREFGKGFDFLDNYMEGKAYSEGSIVSAFGAEGSSYTLIEPTFIYGGDKFGLKPPRVASFYGQFIESLLASAPFRAATNIAPEGFIKIALEPPVSATSVAKAAVAGALGKSTASVLDTYDKIMEASSLV